MKIDLSKTRFKIPKNYVLIKPDEDFETYQLAGRETGIIAPLVFNDEQGKEHSTKQQNISITGVVYAVPERLEFNAKEIWNLQDNNERRRGVMVRERHIQIRIDELRKNSTLFHSPMELKTGDSVVFEYMAHMVADQEGLWVDTTDGLMMLIKYDMLILAVRKGEPIMLNGTVLIKNEARATEQIQIDDNIVDAEISPNGIIISTGKKDNKTRKTAIATVVNIGMGCAGYLDERTASDFPIMKVKDGNPSFDNEDIEIGSKIQYDPRRAKELEYGLHRIFDGDRLLRIQRKDIQFIIN